jgi:hypothetical protein
MFKFRFVAIVAGAVSLLAFGSGIANAAVDITGSRDRLRVQAKDAPLNDILAVLRDRYGLVYRSHSFLNEPVSGEYNGSLESIVGQLTRRYDHALKIKNGVVELVFTNQEKSTAKAPPPPPDPTAATTNSPVTTALEVQAKQMLAFNGGTNPSAMAAGSGGAIGGAKGAIGGAMGSAGGTPSAPTQSAMAEMTGRAMASVRALSQALANVSTPQSR